MALPTYGQDVIRRRLGTTTQAQPNQFSVPSATDTASNMQPPQFYPISSEPVQQYPKRDQEPDRSSYYNPNYSSGPIQNPYPGIVVSPTGEVTGTQGMQPTTVRNNDRRNPGDNQSRNPKGTMNPKNDPNMKKQSKDKFSKGFYSDFNDKQKKWLRGDPALQDQLRQLLASQGDFASQFNTNTGNIADIFRRSINDINRNRGVAEEDLNANMAGSGLIRSSGYGQELGNLMSDFDRQSFDARMAKTTGFADQFAERQNFMRQLEIAKLQARSDALRRLAAQQMDVGGLIG